MAMHRVRQEMRCGKAERAEEACCPWGGESAGASVNHVRPHDRCTEGNKSTKLGAQLCPELPGPVAQETLPAVPQVSEVHYP